MAFCDSYGTSLRTHLKILCLLFLLPLFAAAENAPRPAPKLASYRIGAILPFTGEAASWAESIRYGITLAREELPPGERERIEVIYENDAFKPAQSAAAFHKLVNTQKVQAVFVFGSGIGNVIAPLAERGKIILIAIGASDRNVAANRTYTFTHWVSPEIEAQKMVEEVHRRGYRRIALVSQENDGLRVLGESFLAALSRGGQAPAVVYQNTFAPDTQDFLSVIPQIRARQSDAICVLMLPSSLAAFAKQSRARGFGGDFFGADVFEVREAVAAAEGALAGAWYANGNLGGSDFCQAFEARFGKPPGPTAANGYDSVKLMSAALGASDGDNARIAAYLHSIRNFRGAFGTYSATGDNRFILPAVIKRVTKNGFETINE